MITRSILRQAISAWPDPHPPHEQEVLTSGKLIILQMTDPYSFGSSCSAAHSVFVKTIFALFEDEFQDDISSIVFYGLRK